MLHRAHTEGLILISQPAHAWVSGQIARMWAWNEHSLKEELFLATEQHDLGFLEPDRSPTLNPDTGWPYSFLDMPARPHLEIWTRGIQQMLRFGRYPALLVSRHFSWLAKKNGHEACDQPLYDQFISEQELLQTTLLTSLRNDFYYNSFAEDEGIAEKQQLVSLWDRISLLVCMAVKEPATFSGVPTTRGKTDLTLAMSHNSPLVYVLDPWPFACPKVTLVCEGRHLLKKSATQSELLDAFKAAAPRTLVFELVRKAEDRP